MTKKIVDLFLDGYLGDEIVCTFAYRTDKGDWYLILSKKYLVDILRFKVSYSFGIPTINLYSSADLEKTVNSYCGTEMMDCPDYIKEWFCKKHNVVKSEDMLKFIPAQDLTH
jgi:hypothetical protein